MSGTIETPAGLDKLTPDESALFERMRADEPPDAGEEAAVAAQDAPPEEAATEAPAPRETKQPRQQATQRVPLAEMLEERSRRKQAEQHLAESERKRAEDMARLQERLNLVTGIAQVATTPQQAPVEAALPDVSADPIAHFRAVAERMERRLGEQQALIAGFQQQQQQQRAMSDLRAWGDAQERAFAASEPTYPAAMAHLERSRRDELTALGVTDPLVQSRVLAEDVRQIAALARQDGGNFAQRLYALAERRGFQKTPVQAGTSAGAVPPLDADPAQSVARMQAARDNATTIGSAGSAPPTRLSVEKIAGMSEREFGALVAKLRGDPNALRDLMGH